VLDEPDARSHARSASLHAHAGQSEVELRLEPRAADEGARPPRSGVVSTSDANEPTGVAEVRVLAADGTPAVGVLVARRTPSDPRRYAPVEIRATDHEGRVRWDELAVGRHELCVLSGVFGLQEARESWSPLEVRADESAQLELHSAPRATLRGVARSGGEVLARARVLLRPAQAEGDGRSAMLTTTTDAQGRFELGDLPLGAYRLQLVHPARALPEERSVELTEGGVEVALDLPDAWIQGLVHDAAGHALAGVALRVLPDEDEPGAVGPPWRASARVAAHTDEGGRFELRGLDPAHAVRLELTRDGCATLRSAPLAPASFAEFVLPPEAVLALTLAGTDALLVARGPHGEERTQPVPAGSRTEIHGLGQGTWHLRLETRSDRGPREARASAEREVELESGKTTELDWSVR
jgi:hypothetical protein